MTVWVRSRLGIQFQGFFGGLLAFRGQTLGQFQFGLTRPHHRIVRGEFGGLVGGGLGFVQVKAALFGIR